MRFLGPSGARCWRLWLGCPCFGWGCMAWACAVFRHGCSDHASWNNRGYVASFPFESSMATHNPFIHSASDTVANFGNQASHALKFTRLALAWAVELASDATPAALVAPVAPQPAAIKAASR